MAEEALVRLVQVGLILGRQVLVHELVCWFELVGNLDTILAVLGLVDHQWVLGHPLQPG